jgi:threonine/homoserine/homoserine lactone efflux protein
MVTHLALTRPPAHVGFALLGNVSGVLLLGACALLGWATVLETMPWLRAAVYGLGGAYLIYFGARLLRGAVTRVPGSANTDEPTVTLLTEPWKATMLGFWTALSNAQAILFITSIFAVSGVLNANAATGVAVLGIIGICNLTYLGCLAWMFRRDAIRQSYQRYRRWFEGSIGVLFVAFGGRLVAREFGR